MKPRSYFFIAAGLVLVLGIFFVLGTQPKLASKDSILLTSTPNPGEKLNGETVDGQLLFSRQGYLWVWKGNTATRLPVEPGNSVIANQNGKLLQATISPLNTNIIFVRQDETFSDLWLASADGKNARNFTSNKGKGVPRTENYNSSSLWAFAPAWSPDGSQIAYLSDVQTDDLALWITSSKAFQPKRVSSFAVGQGGLEGPSWSPDGSQIAVAGFDNGKSQIYSIRVNNGKESRLTETEEGALDPAWSPDGKYIAYVARRGNGNYLYLMKADGSEIVQLAPGVIARSPEWSPDGKKIAFLGLRGDSFELFTVMLNSAATGAEGEPKQISREAKIDATGGLSWGK